MSIYYFVIFIAVILILIEMTTLLLESTGLPKAVARFQAVSLLTGTGYTTTEAELITKHPVRRKVAEFLILFGNLSFALLIAVFLNFLNTEFRISELIIGILGVTALFFIFRIRKVQSLMLKKMKANLNQVTTLEEIFHLREQDVVLEIELMEKHQHLFRSLRELNLATDSGIHILTISRAVENGDRELRELIKYPTGSTKLRLGDKVTLFGNKEAIARIFGKSVIQHM